MCKNIATTYILVQIINTLAITYAIVQDITKEPKFDMVELFKRKTV